jgi:uncharacterized membrane protein
MQAFWQSALVQLVVWGAVGAVLVAVGVYVVSKVRAGFHSDASPTSRLVNDFRELHSKGELSEQEFRTIKTMLAARIQQEVKGKGNAG